MLIKLNGAVTTFIAKVRPDGESWDSCCTDPLPSVPTSLRPF
jgi:hypothetical protein